MPFILVHLSIIRSRRMVRIRRLNCKNVRTALWWMVFHTCSERKAGALSFLEVPTSTSADIIFLECASIRNDFEHLKTFFYKDCNLFVSDDDIKLIGKQLDKTEKALKNLEIKVQNTKLLMLR